MKLLKTGMYFLLCLSLIVACSTDDGTSSSTSTTTIANLDFTITTEAGSGNTVSVLPSSSGATLYSVDFGDASTTDDIKTTAGPKVTYTYPSAEATYTITVTASATGAENAVLTKEHSVVISVPQTDVVGRWVLLHDAGALGIGPSAENFSWWSNKLADVSTRDCLFDDVYEFKADGSFVNVVGTETWGEAWSGTDPEACASPVAPFDGTASATWYHDEAAGTIKITGKGAFLGLAKVANGYELNAPEAATESITYKNVSFSDDKNTMIVQITVDNSAADDGANAYWQFKFAKEGTAGAMLDQTDSDGDGVIDANDACPDVAGTEANGCPPSGIGADPSDDFEGSGNITWVGDAAGVNTAFANPSKSGINTSNTVLEYDDAGGQYANIRFDLNEAKTDKFDLSTKNIIKVKVYVPTPDVAVTQPKTLAVKLQDGSSGSPWEGQVVVEQNYTYDTWQELTFDFSEYSAETKFSRVVVQFNSENNFEIVKAYIDDFTYGAN